MADWAKIKAEYIADQSMSYRKLAKKHGVSRSAIQVRATKEKWVDLRGQKQAKSTSAVVDACATKEAEKAIKIYEAADKALEVILDRLADPRLGSQAIKQLTSALRDVAAVKGLQTDADRREQEARIAKLQREAAAAEESDDKEYVLRIKGLSSGDIEGIIG